MTELQSNILGPQLSRLILDQFPNEKACLDAILDGSIEWLPWLVGMKADFAQARPICAGHIYGMPKVKGPQPAPVMVIGKLPRPADIENKHENFEGCCFSREDSPAGKYFYDTALEFGVDPNTWYVTYLFKTLHPEDADRGSRLMATWLKECFPILQHEISQVSPSYILVYGAEACKALFGNTAKITKLTGTVLDYSYLDYNGQPRVAKCVCCTSPYAVTRSGDSEESAKYRAAFQLFVNLINDNLASDKVDHQAVRTIADWRRLKIKMGFECVDKVIAIDAEWNGQHPQNSDGWIRTIQFSWKDNTAASLIVRDTKGNECFTPEELQEIKRDFAAIWQRYIIAGHYLDADVEFLAYEGYIPDIQTLPFIPPNGTEYERYCKSSMPCLFDTALAAHAYCETDDHSLTAQVMLRLPTVPRYDTGIDNWKKLYCKQQKIKEKDLEGYGACPDDVIVPYGCYDADVTRRLALWYTRNLEKDCYGLNCWEAFSNSMQQWPVFLEMNCTGICVDRDRIDDLMSLYSKEAKKLIALVRENLAWPTFNINSHYQLREALFGTEFSFAKKAGDLRPPDAITLGLTPLYATDGTPWDKVMADFSDLEEGHAKDHAELKQKLAVPTCNARSLSLLAANHASIFAESKREKDGLTVQTLTAMRGAKLLQKALSYVLKEPTVEDDGSETERGLSAFICDDGRLRSHFYCTLDTGRAASARPALQNISKKREESYQEIVGDKYIGPLRSILRAPPGHLLCWADLKGAELAA